MGPTDTLPPWVGPAQNLPQVTHLSQGWPWVGLRYAVFIGICFLVDGRVAGHLGATNGLKNQ